MSHRILLVNFLALVSLVFFLFLNCGTAVASESGWQTIFNGISMKTVQQSSPVRQSMYIVRVDLKTHGVGFLVSPSNGDEPEEIGAMRTSSFLAKYKCQVAINGSVFSPKALREGQGVNVHGLSVSSGVEYSKPTRFDALMVRKDGSLAINSPPFNLSGVEHALSGYYKILSKGKIVGGAGKRHPRSLVGVSRSGRYLFMAVIDGRRPGISEGANLKEAADAMRRVGAWDALNLDGGGSSTLVIAGQNGVPKVVNRPSDGVERLVANHLCVFAQQI